MVLGFCSEVFNNLERRLRMYTSLMMVALFGGPAAQPEASSPTWLVDYEQANQQGQNEKKPLAIFVGTGKKGYEKLVRKGKLTPRMQKSLAENYVCVYANTRNKKGKRLAKQFHLRKGLLISNRAGTRLALRHEGSVKVKALNRYLTKFADPDLVVKKTEKHKLRIRRPAPVPMMMGGGGC
jgi:hypothetical protein